MGFVQIAKKRQPVALTNPLSEYFEPDLRNKLLNLGVRKQFGTNEQIFAEGSEATFLPIVLAGQIKLVRYPVVGKEVILGVFSPGEIFAIPPALDGKRFPATAVSIGESELLILPRRDFLNLMETAKGFSSVIMGRMCRILRDRADTAQIFATPSAEHRVAAVLLQLGDRLGMDQSKVISHRRQDIAEMSGLTTETAIRAIRKLADKGLLRIAGGKIVLETTEPLREFIR